MTDATGPTAFLNKTYDEAFALLIEARNYIAYEEAADRAALDDGRRLMLSLETMRLTTRMTEIMAWLLHQKAVFAGEISRDEAMAADRRLGRPDICLKETQNSLGLPERLTELMARSRQLYVRVARLDEVMERDSRPPQIEDLWPGD